MEVAYRDIVDLRGMTKFNRAMGSVNKMADARAKTQVWNLRTYGGHRVPVLTAAKVKGEYRWRGCI